MAPSSLCADDGESGVDEMNVERDFAGVVLGNRLAGKEKTMGPRMRILDLMAASRLESECGK